MKSKVVSMRDVRFPPQPGFCRRFAQILSIVAIPLSWAIPQPAWAGKQSSKPYSGITWTVQTESSPRRITMRYVEIELETPGLRFKLTPPRGPMDTLRQSTLGFLKEQSAELAINAHFYVPYLTETPEANLVGLAVSDGIVVSPFEGQPVGKGFQDQSYAILPFAPALNLDRSNRVSIVRYDPGVVVSKGTVAPSPLWTAVSGSAQIVTDGKRSVPRYVGLPHGLNPMNGYNDSNSWYEVPRARTAIGFDREGSKLILFTVDHDLRSRGMTVGEVADFLIRELGIHQALNLDGGPSTSIALRDPQTGHCQLMNHPPGGEGGPALGSNLCVFAPRVADADPRPPANREPTQSSSK